MHYDNASVGSYVSDFELDTNIDDNGSEAEPTNKHPTRAVSSHEVSKLLQLCELTIMESNNELL